jgi:murein DD-endopeptidase MepM/ murein hydrolase activator NlpD
VRPAYNRFYLAATAWPTPDPSVTLPHFWLSPPFSGSDRLLINQSYPYGSDGDGRYLLHNGVDAAEPLGTPLLAVADGTVVVAQSDRNELYGWRCDWYGQLVAIELDDTWQGQPMYVLYGHVLNIEVEVGQRVNRGQPVAAIGVGGVATVPHLHLEVRVGSNDFESTRNPVLWLHPGKERGLIVGRLMDPDGRPWQGVTLTLIDSDADPQFTNTWSYLDDPQHLIHPDEGWAENFVFAGVRPGSHVVYAKVQGVEYRVPVQVNAGEASVVEIVTEPYKTPTPTPAVTDPPPSPESDDG